MRPHTGGSVLEWRVGLNTGCLRKGWERTQQAKSQHWLHATALSVCSGCYHSLPETGWLIQRDVYTLEAAALKQSASMIVIWSDPSSGLLMTTVSLCPHLAERRWGSFLWFLYKGTNLIQEGFTHMTSSPPRWLPPNAIAPEVRISTHEVWRDSPSVHYRLLDKVFLCKWSRISKIKNCWIRIHTHHVPFLLSY